MFQTFANRDLRQFKKLTMYIHAEEAKKTNPSLENIPNALTAVVRIGTDFISNYYEVRIPLSLTSLGAASLDPNSTTYNDTLWIAHNGLNVDLPTLVAMKQQRNISGRSTDTIYRQTQPNGQVYSVLGNPNIAEVRGILIGVENTKAPTACGEMWVNELALSALDETGGSAALVRADLQLSDLGTISLSANGHTTGFGTLEQRINDRYRDNFYQFDATATLELGKLLPKKAGITIPVMASISQAVSTPEYDPYDLDIKLKDKVGNAKSKAERDSIKNNAIDYTRTTTLTVTNAKKNKTNGKKPKIYDISNFDFSYAYLKTKAHTPLIENNEITRHR
ncbi:MAG TPA: cell surface protein SprA, partial [Ferruginibacter sp.]|nr:cell surface protein SprA [Ferruginibacter sp.]